jgi:hypothetical protein
MRLVLTRGGAKKYTSLLFITPPVKFSQLYNKDTPRGICNLWHVLHSPLLINY